MHCRSRSTIGNSTATCAAQIRSRGWSLACSIRPSGSRDSLSAKARSVPASSATRALLSTTCAGRCPERLPSRSTRARASSAVTKSRHRRRRNRLSSPHASAHAASIAMHIRGMFGNSAKRRAWSAHAVAATFPPVASIHRTEPAALPPSNLRAMESDGASVRASIERTASHRPSLRCLTKSAISTASVALCISSGRPARTDVRSARSSRTVCKKSTGPGSRAHARGRLTPNQPA